MELTVAGTIHRLDRVRAHAGVDLTQGCQMVYFHTKKSQLGYFWRALEWKMLLYFMAIWYFCHLGSIVFPILVPCTKKNLGNPDSTLISVVINLRLQAYEDGSK
jgi:hypothetical protein